jgi:hypothetical protein
MIEGRAGAGTEELFVLSTKGIKLRIEPPKMLENLQAYQRKLFRRRPHRVVTYSQE